MLLPQASIRSIASELDGAITAGEQGAIIFVIDPSNVTLERYENIAQLAIKSLLSTTGAAEDFPFSWRPFAEAMPQFAGVEFYNAKGTMVHFEDGELLCQIQLWAAGKGVGVICQKKKHSRNTDHTVLPDCGLHNHSTDDFCELHACIRNGTGSGGMTYGRTLEKDAEQIPLVGAVQALSWFIPLH